MLAFTNYYIFNKNTITGAQRPNIDTSIIFYR